MRNCFNLLCGTAAVLVAGTLPAAAQTKYPSRPIEMIQTSTLPQARILMDKVSEIIGVPFVASSQQGANGNLAAVTVSKAAPDGYTMLYSSSALVVNPALYRNGVDPVKGLTPVSLTSSSANALMINTKTHPEITKLSDFITFAKSRAGKLNYAGGPPGNVSHIMAVLFLKESGIQATHIPYDTGPQQATALLSGDVEFVFLSPSSAIGFVNEKRLTPLAVSSLKRLQSLPNVPTLDESGLRGYEVTSWNAIMMPPNTPPAIAQFMNEAFRKALEAPDVRAKLAPLDVVPLGTMSPPEYAAYLTKEVAYYSKFVQDVGIKVE